MDPLWQNCEVAVNRLGIATLPCKTNVDIARWLSFRPIKVALWSVLVTVSIAFAFVSPIGNYLCLLVFLFAANYWYRIWKHFWYGHLAPAILIDKEKSLVAAYSNLSQTNECHPHIKVMPLQLSQATLQGRKIGSRIVTVPRYEPPIHGTRWVDFAPIPLEQAVGDEETYAECESKIPEAQWELLEYALTTLPKPITPGLYDISVLHEVERYPGDRIDSIPKAQQVDVRRHYVWVGVLIISLMALAMYLQSDSYGTQVRLGDSYAKIGNDREAISAYESAVRISPKEPRAYFHRAVLYQKSGQHLKAQIDFDEVLRLRPEFGPAYRLRAVSCEALQLKEKAESDHHQADVLGAPKTVTEPFEIDL